MLDCRVVFTVAASSHSVGEAHKIEGLEDLNKDHVAETHCALSVFGIYKPPFADFFHRP